MRQSQAHAWAEVWLDGQGWVRIDPTAVVAPGRLQQDSGEHLAVRAAGLGSLFRRCGLAAEPAGTPWDAANNWWQERVVNFNRSAQLDLPAQSRPW